MLYLELGIFLIHILSPEKQYEITQELGKVAQMKKYQLYKVLVISKPVSLVVLKHSSL